MRPPIDLQLQGARHYDAGSRAVKTWMSKVDEPAYCHVQSRLWQSHVGPPCTARLRLRRQYCQIQRQSSDGDDPGIRQPGKIGASSVASHGIVLRALRSAGTLWSFPRADTLAMLGAQERHPPREGSWGCERRPFPDHFSRRVTPSACC